MIKLSNEKLVNSIQALNNLSQQQLPITISYAISKNIDKIESELKIYNKERKKLIEKYSAKDEDGKTKFGENESVTIEVEYIEDWNREMIELLGMENEIHIHQISISKLEDSNFNIAPSELMKIDYMIAEQ